MPKLTVKPKAAQLLIDVIDIHVLGVLEAKQLTTDDPTIDSAEQLLDIMSGYDEDLKELSRIRKQLTIPTMRDIVIEGLDGYRKEKTKW